MKQTKPNNGVPTYDAMAKFYTETNPLTDLPRFKHMAKERMKEVFNDIYPKLVVEKNKDLVEEAILELNQN